MIRIENLHLTYRSAHGEVHAVRGVDLDIAAGQFYTLLGPSGCGKTTTLRCVAGLERPSSGRITVGEQVVFSSANGISVPSFDRNIGMVFQSYAIWPHMSVFDNVAFPLRQLRPRPQRKDIRDRVMRSLELVHLGGLAERPAPYLSGGQQQRLALARALVREPNVLLLDEPLSNLDAKLREEMRSELRDLVETLGVTTLFVTHEQIEALTMSDCIGVMQEGIIAQEGTPMEIYDQPDGTFVADFIGKTNFIRGTVVAGDGNGFAQVKTPLGVFSARTRQELATGAEATIAIRPENVVTADGAATGNVIAGTVRKRAFLGNLLDCAVVTGGEVLHMQTHPATALRVGDAVRLHLPPQSCIVIRS
jgi:iron(III) transport system ATP-binding protein